MKRYSFIYFLYIGIILIGCNMVVSADDFIDDIYYTPAQDLRKEKVAERSLKPSYDKKVREIVFIEDTVPPHAQADTVVKAVIRMVDKTQIVKH